MHVEGMAPLYMLALMHLAAGSAGTQQTSGVHVDDLARLYVLALKHASAGTVYFATSSNNSSARWVSVMHCKLTGHSHHCRSPIMRQESCTSAMAAC